MITLTFTQEQLQVLDKAIADLPFRVAAPLVQEINKQIHAQQTQEAAKLEGECNHNKD